MAHCGTDAVLGAVQKPCQRQAHVVRAKAQNRQPVFRPGQTRFDKDRLMQGHQAVLIFEGRRVIATKRCLLEFFTDDEKQELKLENYDSEE